MIRYRARAQRWLQSVGRSEGYVGSLGSPGRSKLGIACLLFLVARGAPPPLARSAPFLPSRASRSFFQLLAGPHPRSRAQRRSCRRGLRSLFLVARGAPPPLARSAPLLPSRASRSFS